MTSYCTLQGARRQAMVDPTITNEQEDSDLFFYMLTSAAAIDDWTGNWFDERVLQLGFNGNVGQHNPILYLKEQPLAAITTLTNGNGDVIAAANYDLLPTGTYPKKEVRLHRGYFWRGPLDQPGATSSAACCAYGPLADRAYAVDAIQIAGRWVFHRNYPKAWRTISLTLGASMDDDTTELTLSSAAGRLLDVGNVIRVTTSGSDIQTEQMLIVGPISASTPDGFDTVAVTVERAYNGTTAIVHNSGDPIAVWHPDGMIPNIAEMAAAALYKGRVNPTGDTQVSAEFGTLTIPVDLPAKIKTFLVPYRSWRRGRP
jgi:hypothetical protein